jgi:uncharacterized protein (DUF433 family)
VEAGAVRAGIKAEVVSDPTVMSGDPVVKGTRILAETILGYLRADYSPQAIFEDYPSLPVDGIDAVAWWAEKTYGTDWKSAVIAYVAGRQVLNSANTCAIFSS